MESILQNGYISVFGPPFLNSDCDRGGGVLVLRTGYAADWPPEILGRVGRKIQKANFAETQNRVQHGQEAGAIALEGKDEVQVSMVE